MTSRIVDLSHPVTVDTPPFPGDPPVEVAALDATEASDREPREHLNVGRLAMCLHCGTHMDAPFHFYGDGATIDAAPLDVCVGPAVRIDLSPLPAEAEIGVARLEPHAAAVAETGRVILATGWERRWMKDDYFTRHPVITAEAAAWLVEAGCRLVGVDFPSVDREPYSAHLELLGSDVLIIENLTNLATLDRERFELIATPLAIVGRDGSPVRVVARLADAGNS